MNFVNLIHDVTLRSRVDRLGSLLLWTSQLNFILESYILVSSKQGDWTRG